ncbi:hexitol phosphatase HxpB [Maribacter sp. ACAM166]|uniref:hexitol phosphatase HxpB n=1 Tax=Maribacter sp. ACAM166 TaxID=2508996 RepID=UPI0010FDC608|nr:hexitol phosphatase HxpB [Maribacter sp. ACAM166]TLP71162.1 hexitol phosphatase HxpB [Maribacter sp. ACAM166]
MKAVIFDMDGVIINSEPFWKKAEKEVFTSLGVQVTDEFAKITARMTTTEVTRFWFEKYPWKMTPFEEVEQMVVSKVITSIKKEGREIPGIHKFMAFLKQEKFKLGLATNSPYSIIPAVLEKIGLTNTFDVIVSAEFETKGKPDPAVYLTTSQKLNINPKNCFVIEDSCSGMQAAKTAGMKVIAFTNENKNIYLPSVNYKIDSFQDPDFSIFI